MNQNAKLWVEALRSGKYRQVKGRLKTVDGYCCLGVACEVAIKAGVPVSVGTFGLFPAFDGETARLPRAVRDWLGLRDDYGTHGDDVTSLTHENDHGKTFLEIADIIESEPEGLFLPEPSNPARE